MGDSSDAMVRDRPFTVSISVWMEDCYREGRRSAREE